MVERGLRPDPLFLGSGEQFTEVRPGTVLGKVRITGEEEEYDTGFGKWAKTVLEPVEGLAKELELTRLPDLRVTLGKPLFGTERGSGVYEVTYEGVRIVDSRPEHYGEYATYKLKWAGE